MKSDTLDIVAPEIATDVDPISGLPWPRVMLKPEYVLAFKRVLGKGVEVHSVLGDRILVSEIIPHTEVDERNQNLARDGVKTQIIAPPGSWRGDTYVPLQGPPACTGFVVAVGDEMSHPLVRERACVAFGQYSGTAFSVGKAKFRLLDTKEILFVLRSVEGQTMESVHLPVRVDIAEGFGAYAPMKGTALTDVIAPVKAGA